MWNISWKNRKKKEVRDIAATWGILEEFARRGLLYWKAEDKILLIEESLAYIKMKEGKSGFLHFLNQVSMWQNYKILLEKYELKRIELETTAVRNVRKTGVPLTKSDIMRIRQNARLQMEEISVEELSVINEFDIYVIRASASSAHTATAENGQLLVVGHYDGQRVEMALFDDIKNILLRDGNDE